MTSALLRQFTQGRQKIFATEYSKIVGHKRPKLLDSVIPNLYQNLYDSTTAFVEAVAALDTEFVQSTSTLALQKVLIPEMENLKTARTSIKLVPWQGGNQAKKDSTAPVQQGEEEKNPILLVSPYVIFGQTMEERLKLQRPWQYTKHLFATNRFLAVDPIQGFSFSKFMNSQIFGFNCFMVQFKGFEISEGNTTHTYAPRQMLVSFETDSENHEFYVSDFNNLVKSSE